MKSKKLPALLFNMKIHPYCLFIMFAGFFVEIAAVSPKAFGQTSSSAAYRLRPGDLLAVEVRSPGWPTNDADENRQQMLILKDGTAKLAGLSNPLKLAGLTLEEATKVLNAAIQEGKVFHAFSVSIGIKSYASRGVSVQGHVLYPGFVKFQSGQHLTIMKAITQAGGLKSETSHNLTLMRQLPDGKTTVSNIDFFDVLTDSGNDILLEDGDMITAL